MIDTIVILQRLASCPFGAVAVSVLFPAVVFVSAGFVAQLVNPVSEESRKSSSFAFLHEVNLCGFDFMANSDSIGQVSSRELMSYPSEFSDKGYAGFVSFHDPAEYPVSAPCTLLELLI